MTENRKNHREILDRLTSEIVEDLLNAADSEVAEDLMAEGYNLSDEANAMRAVIEQAARKCGKARLQSAKDSLALMNKSLLRGDTQIDVMEARRRLAEIFRQSQGLSMAARNESELSDNDVLGMLADFEELGVVSGSELPDEDS